MRCEYCKHWLVAITTPYDDGSVIFNFKAADGHGLCRKLDKEFPADFGCNYFIEDSWDHTEQNPLKAGAPWQHSRNDTCPDCKGYGFGCVRCAGTGKVRHYDDGYVGEEQTRLHPKEKEILAAGGSLTPKCVNCAKELDPSWMNCPWCGVRSNRPGPREVIGFKVGEVQGTTDEMMSKMIAARAARAGERGGDSLSGTQGQQP